MCGPRPELAQQTTGFGLPVGEQRAARRPAEHQPEHVAYGVAAMGGAQAVRRLAGRLGPVALIVTGGIQLTPEYAAAALHPSLATLTLTALLLGGGWAFLHSTVQAWATQVVPGARATGVAFFGVALYLGSALGTGLGSAAAQRGAFQGLFGMAAVLSLPLTALAAYGRHRHDSASRRERSRREAESGPSDPRTDGAPHRG
ncbi:MFS transporter [Streptomyces sp. NPDC059928]|uniref:MFS transporter n=1 Tax=unclassified Streptomyces TaxID=2593676 RepID=UPI00366238FF